MLDMTGYKTSEQEAIRAEIIARRLLAEELKGNYDIGALIGSDEAGNLWVYSSEEAKEAASRRSALSDLNSNASGHSDAASDPGYHSDDEKSASTEMGDMERSDARLLAATDGGVITPPQTPPEIQPASESKNYAKTLRLTSEQLKSLGLRPGANSMKFSVNKASCTAYMYFWEYSASIVISDIDGTITK
jgi:phosphatidate phosphatase LPIN